MGEHTVGAAVRDTSHADERPKPKDNWDKAGIAMQALVPVMLAVLTGVYGCYEKAQQETAATQIALLEEQKTTAAKANAVASLLPFIKSNPDSAQAEVVAVTLTSLGYGKLAVNLARFSTNRGSVDALRVIAATTDSASTRDSALAALAQISDRSSPGAQSASLAAAADTALARLQSAGTTPQSGSWAVVVGGFGSVPAALADARAAQARGYRAEVFVRNGVARTAIQYDDRAAVTAALPRIKAEVRRTSYGVRFSGWCPNPTQTGEYVSCAPSSPERVDLQ
jgi:hypothetical protein